MSPICRTPPTNLRSAANSLSSTGIVVFLRCRFIARPRARHHPGAAHRGAAIRTERIALLTTFADQAAIAIENVRIFKAEQQRTEELSAALEQQTATANVLDVVGRFGVRS